MTRRILHLVEKLSLGGASQSLLGLARQSIKEGFNHVLFSIFPPDRRALQSAVEIGLEIARPGMPELFSQIQKADIVQIHFWNSPALYEILQIPWPEARILLWCHISGDHPPQTLTPELVTFPDAIVASSHHTAQLPVFKNAGQDKLTRVIIDTPDFEKLDRFTREKQSQFTVAHVGTVDFIKMHPDFIRMHATANIPNLKVVVCGDGPALRKLKGQAVLFGFPERFEFVGFQAEPGAILSQADVFGYPLSDENYATSELALQEAMYLGVPPLLLASNGPALMIQDGQTGLLASSPNDYTLKLELLASSKALRKSLSKNAAAYARAHWGSPRIVKQMHALYDELLLRHKRPVLNLIPSTEFQGANSFIRSLGKSAPQFTISLEGRAVHGIAIEKAADRRVSESSLLLSSPSAGGVLHYRFNYPSDPYLHFWSGLILAKQGRTALASMEFKQAERLGFDTERIAPYINHPVELPERILTTQISPLQGNSVTPQTTFQRAFNRIEKEQGAVLFCGASVTAQKTGYRALLAQWIHEHTATEMKPIHACLGGIGSFGCAYLLHRALDKNPDQPALCFIECLTGDIGIRAQPHAIAEYLEGMLLRLLKRGSAICFIFLYHDRMKDSDSLLLREMYVKIASYYRVPIIDLASGFIQLINSGEASQVSLLRDGIHTTPAGSYIASSHIANQLQKFKADWSLSDPGIHIPEPLHPSTAPYLYQWDILPSQLAETLTQKWGVFQAASRYLTIDTGEIFEITLDDGELTGILFVNGPHSGNIKVYTSSHVGHEYVLKDKWSHYRRLHMIQFKDPQLLTQHICLRPSGENSAGLLSSLAIVGLLLRSTQSQKPHLTMKLSRL